MVETEQDRQSMLETFGERIQPGNILGIYSVKQDLIGELAEISTYIPTITISTEDATQYNIKKGSAIVRANGLSYKVVRMMDDGIGMTTLQLQTS